MNQDEIRTIFEKQASTYDEQWKKSAPIRDGLHFLLEAVFAELPARANILSVGAGTGVEIAYLAKRYPHWRFTAVEPSGAMLEICRKKAEKEGYLSRCTLYEGYLHSLPAGDPFDAAISFLVSHFIQNVEARTDFFRQIATRLKPGGILASSDLSAEVGSDSYEALLPVWLRATTTSVSSSKDMSKMREKYSQDVAILPPAEVAKIIRAAGFEQPVEFYQAGLIHAWFCRCISSKVD